MSSGVKAYMVNGTRTVYVSVDVQIQHPSSTTLEEYHILRVVSLVTSGNLILGRFSDRNILWF